MAWKKGESGNPNGRPKKGESFTDALRGEFTKEELAKKMREHIEAGNFAALQYVYDRVDGKSTQRVETSNPLDEEWLEIFKDVHDKADGETKGDSPALREESAKDTDS